MTHKQFKILKLSFILYNYWRPSSWVDPVTPLSWSCAIADITDLGHSIELNNYITMESVSINDTKQLAKHLRLVDELLKRDKFNHTSSSIG